MFNRKKEAKQKQESKHELCPPILTNLKTTRHPPILTTRKTILSTRISRPTIDEIMQVGESTSSRHYINVLEVKMKRIEKKVHELELRVEQHGLKTELHELELHEEAGKVRLLLLKIVTPFTSSVTFALLSIMVIVFLFFRK